MLRHKLLVTLVWVVVTFAGAFATTQVTDRLTTQWAQPGRPGYEANQEIIRTYETGGNGTPLVPVVTLPAGQTVDSPGVRESLDQAFQAAAQATDARVVSYPNTGDRRFVGADGRTTFALFYLERQGGFGGPDRSSQLLEALGAGLAAGATVEVTGMTPLQDTDNSGSGPSVLVETLVGGLGALLVLIFVFGSLLALVPLLIAVISILASFLFVYGLTGVTDVSSIVEYIVALIGLGVAIDYSLLLVTRWREERSRGHDGDEAVRRAMATAGRSVLFSGVTVAVGLFAMVALPVPFLRSIGYGGLMIPLVSTAVVLTLLPVLLAVAGNRLDWPHRRRDASSSRVWTAWARFVVRFRWLVAVAGTAVLVALSVFALNLHIGDPESKTLADSGPAYQALADLRATGVPTGVLTPVEVLVPAGMDPAAVASDLAAVPGVHTAVAPDGPAWRRDGTALVAVLPVAEGGSDAGKETVERIRAAAPAGVQVGGPTAQGIDFVDSVYGAFPVMLLLIAIATYVLLARGFRSLVLPLKAILLNLLSLGAIFGAMVLIWQYGYGSEQIWGITATGSITEFVPVMIFAFLYGLSIDYEVFILARMREEYDRTGVTNTAVVEGIGRTGRLVTSAALILFLAFASLAAAPETEIKVFATGLGLGILLDATIIRAALVPALVSILGKWNWWLPGWAAKALFLKPRPTHLDSSAEAPDLHLAEDEQAVRR